MVVAFSPKPSCRLDDAARMRRNHWLNPGSTNGVITEKGPHFSLLPLVYHVLPLSICSTTLPSTDQNFHFQIIEKTLDLKSFPTSHS